MHDQTHKSLVRTITQNIAITAFLAMLIQLAIVIVQIYFDEPGLHVNYVTHHARVLHDRLKKTASGYELRSDLIPAHYLHGAGGDYAFRVLTDDGHVIEERNGELLRGISPWAASPHGAQDLWIVNLDTERRLFVAGGLRFPEKDRTVLIEVATRGDRSNTAIAVIAREIFDDVWMPMIPLIVLTIGVAMISVRRSLRPLGEMAALAETSTSSMPKIASVSGNLPREVVSFVMAISALIERVQDLTNAQRAFVTRVAHELKTPLAAMMLEVERVGERGTIRLETDIKRLSTLVDRLLMIARLEVRQHAVPQLVNLALLADETIDQYRLLCDRSGHRIALHVHEPVDVVGDAEALQEAVRNLIDNAVQHTPGGTRIVVTVGPGNQLTVEDDGPGWGTFDTLKLLDPFARGASKSHGNGLGLSIVKQAAVVLGGNVVLANSESSGAKATLTW